MSSFKYQNSSSTCSTLINKKKYENRVTILKESSSFNCEIDTRETKGIELYNEDDSYGTSDLISKLKNVNITCDKKATREKKKLTTKKGKNAGAIGNDICETKRGKQVAKTIKSSDTVCNDKNDKAKVRKKNKKDSFIVSDNSSIENDSITIYHRAFTEKIKVDVKKMSRGSRLRKNISFNDHGIFTPYILGRKRSSSESSSSDKENDFDKNVPKFKVIKTDCSSPFLSNTSGQQNDNLGVPSSSSSEKEELSSNKNINLPSSSKASINTNMKDTSWCFSSDDYLSCRSDDNDSTTSRSSKSSKACSNNEDKFQTPPPINKRLNTEEKTKGVVTTAEKSFKPTPITFRLKQLSKLTPKMDKTSPKPSSFLESLSTFGHPEAELYRKKFKKLKGDLVGKLFKMFNEDVFDNQLPADMKIEWNARMRSSSGFCYNKRIKTVIGPNNECLRSSRIALSTKIIETPDRLRDTLIHEMCHAASWIVDNKADGHGPYWKAWASKAMLRYPELPEIRRCHDYAVKTKFQYKCVNCAYTIGRHSKSLNLERKRCGYCYSRFELIVNKESSKNVGLNVSPKSVHARPLSKFAIFVKENYGKVKSENADFKHGDVMKALSKNFALTKTAS